MADKNGRQATGRRSDIVRDQGVYAVCKKDDLVGRTSLRFKKVIISRIGQRSDGMIFIDPLARKQRHDSVVGHATAVKKTSAKNGKIATYRSVFNHDPSIIFISYMPPIFIHVADTTTNGFSFYTKVAIFYC